MSATIGDCHLNERHNAGDLLPNILKVLDLQVKYTEEQFVPFGNFFH
jgi:hypothetical protein